METQEQLNKQIVKTDINGNVIFVGGICKKSQMKEQFKILKDAMR